MVSRYSRHTMSAADTILLVSRLATAAVAAFLAILLWSRTRDLAWMLIVIGVIASYADILFGLLAQPRPRGRVPILLFSGFQSAESSSPISHTFFSAPPSL